LEGALGLLEMEMRLELVERARFGVWFDDFSLEECKDFREVEDAIGVIEE